MKEKQVPTNIEAEKAVLGSMIIDPSSISLMVGVLKVDDFYRNTHRDIYSAMLALYERGDPPDYLMLCDALKDVPSPTDSSWDTYLIHLTDDVPTSAHIESYGDLVRVASLRRRLLYVAGQIAAIAYDESVEEPLDHAEQLLYGLSQQQETGEFAALADILREYLDDLEDLHEHKGQVVGVPTTLYDLDGITGGLQDSDLIVLAARPGQGKTSLALTIALNAALDHKKKVGVFSMEMSKRQLAGRLVSMKSRVDLQRLRTAWLEEKDWDGIVQAVDDIEGAQGKLYIADTSGVTIASMRSKARRLKAQYGLDLLVVDYLQLMQGIDVGKQQNRVQEISDISRGLKLLAVELDIPILALSQLSREVEKRASKVPILSDLRDSGAIEQDADIVLFIYRDEYYYPDSPRKGCADLIIAKHRNGPIGEIELSFIAKQARFDNLPTAALTEVES